MHTTSARTIPTPGYDIFVEGEVVTIKTGGPAMTITNVCEDCGDVEAAYGDSEGNLQFHVFPPEALVRVH